MKTLTVREVPDTVYEAIRREAATNQRSIQEQVRYILTKEVQLREGGFSAAASRWRSKLQGRELGDAVKEIRAGRERR